MESKISKIYYLLSIMHSGLPLNIINLIYNNLDLKLNLIKNDLFYITPHDQWYHINENYKEAIYEYFNIKPYVKKECITNCLKVYARLLLLYIEKTRHDVCFPDSNIHYVFNAYNDDGIWKTFDEGLYEYCFLYEFDKGEYNNVLKNEYNIIEHKDNIIDLIEENIEFITSLLKNNDIVIKEYIEQILLLLPSSFFLKKICKKIINKCIYLSEQLELNDGKKRLLLFLYSLEENPIIEPEYFKMDENESEGIAEAYFLKGLKNKDEYSLRKSIEYYNIVNDSQENHINKRIGYAKYEIGALFYLKKEYTITEKFLNEAKEIEDKFLRDRCNIELVLIIEKKN